MKMCFKLKGTNIFINDDYPMEIEKKRGALRPVLRHVKGVDPKPTLIQDKLRFKGRLYTVESVMKIPIDMSRLGTKLSDTNDMLFAGEYTPLSNFCPCRISIDNTTFPSSEHLFQYKKAASLGQHDIAASILTAPTAFDAMKIRRGTTAGDDWTGLKLKAKN